MPNFWDEFNSGIIHEKDESLKTLPFFHSCDLASFETIVEKKEIEPKNDKKDRFYDKKKVFCYYGKPIYYKPQWDAPYILGFRFKEGVTTIAPTDTGMLMSLKDLKELAISNFLTDNDAVDLFTSHMSIKEAEEIIKNYIYEWFNDNEAYCDSLLLDDKEISLSVCRTFKEKILELNNTFDQFNKDFIEKHGLMRLDQRKLCVEVAFDDKIDLRDCELLFAAIPNDINQKKHRDFLEKTFDLKKEELDKKIYEYNLRRVHKLRKSKNGTEKQKEVRTVKFPLDKLIDNCIEEFQKKFELR